MILDTNVIIDFLEGRESIVNTVSKYLPSELSLTFVNKYELLKYKHSEKIQDALENLFVYQSNDTALLASANAYKRLRSKGLTMSDNDLLIFGVCLANNETLLTEDKAFKDLHSDHIVILE